MYFTTLTVPLAKQEYVAKLFSNFDVSFDVEKGIETAFFQATHADLARLRSCLREISGVLDGFKVSQPKPLDLEKMDDGWSESKLDAVKFKKLRFSYSDELSRDAVYLPSTQAVFGDGCHVTTRLMLKEIESIASLADFQATEMRVLDLGCGNGVLGIALAWLSRHIKAATLPAITGIDICPKAVALAKKTAQVNEIEKIRFDTKFLKAQFDWVLCNIQPPFLFDLLGKLGESMTPGRSTLLLSGYTQFDRGLVEFRLKDYAMQCIEQTSLRGWYASRWQLKD